jgi:hypothetical protein
MFSYGYFVKLPSGRLVPAGQDWGPTDSNFKPGDIRGVKNGTEGFILAVVKGEEAKRNGFDVIVIIEERPVKATNMFERSLQMKNEMRPPRLTSRPQIQADFQGKKFRAVRNTVHIRPQEETFYDFQINMLLWTLGETWFNAEMAKPLPDRHIILQWRHERNELLRSNRKPEDDPKQPVRVTLTGNLRALQVLADDIYQLEHALKTPRKIIARLRDPRQFQGARYEIAVASIFARCGFTIDFIDDRTKRNPEFIAERDGERIAVEAKSRHRTGVLQQPGRVNKAAEPASAKIKHHFEEALQQNPGGLPFLVFIDVNLPLTPSVPHLEKDWVREAMKCFDDRRQEGRTEDPDSGLVLTNFGWHYFRDPGAPPGEAIATHSINPTYPIKQETWQLLDRCLGEYGLIIDQEQHEKNIRARYPEFGK